MSKLKSALLASLTLIFLNGCMNENSENQNIDSTSTDQEELVLTDSASTVDNEKPSLPYIVKYDDATGRLEIDENPNLTNSPQNGDQVILALKSKYPEIVLRLGEKKQDTLEVHIDDATYLTQSIGSAGADSFLAEATYAFTSLDSIKVVNFMFEPGDHAMPGPYSRKYFNDFH